MSRLFEGRERAEELFFARAQEAAFVAHCRAIRRFGALATERMGLDGAAAGSYGDALVDDLTHGAKDDAVVTRVRDDLAARGISIDVLELRAELTRMEASAAAEMAGSAN